MHDAFSVWANCCMSCHMDAMVTGPQAAEHTCDPVVQEKKRDAEAQLSALQGKLQELTMEKAHLETRNRRLQVHPASAWFCSKLRNMPLSSDRSYCKQSQQLHLYTAASQSPADCMYPDLKVL